MRDGDANHEQVQRWLSALRDGTEAEKIAARRGLARVFERRGMLEEAVDLLEANVRAEVRSGEIFRWFDTDVDASHAGALSSSLLRSASRSGLPSGLGASSSGHR